MTSRVLCQLTAIALLASVTVTAHSQLNNSAAIDDYLEQVVSTTKIPGVVALVVDNENVLYSAAFGKQNATAEIPMSMGTLFNIASMTKPVAATAIMILVEEGKLDLDDPISKYVPEFGGKTVISTFKDEDGAYTTQPARQEITIRNLMSHSSGLAYGFSSTTVFRLNGGNAFSDNEDLPLVYEPGTALSYASGIAFVANVLQTITEQSLDVFLAERIFEPLSMIDTTYVVPPGKISRVATIHNMTEKGLVEAPVPDEVRSSVSGDYGLYSTAPDYAKFIQLFLNNGFAPDGTRLLEEETIRIIGENQLGDVRVSLQDEPTPSIARVFPLGAGRDGFGVGFPVTGPHKDPKIRLPGSMSWAGLFNTQFWIDRKAGLGAVLLMQYLPFYDEDAIATLSGFEQRVYEEQ